MDKNDFLGSFAQENVTFQTQVIRTSVVGDNFWKVMIFVENTRFVTSSSLDWVDAPGLPGVRCCTVTADTYSSIARGLLRSWLYDLFATGFTGDCILVACGADVPVTYTYTPVSLTNGEDITGRGLYHRASGSSDEWTLATETTADTSTYEYASRSASVGDPSAFISSMEAAYDVLKPYAYHKTVCAGTDDAVIPAIAVSLATKCAEDKQLLSSAPYFPYATPTPETASSDPLYAALSGANKDAFMSCCADSSRNAALYSLGLALANINGSGTAVGTQLDMIKSANMLPSGQGGTNLPYNVRSMLSGLHIQTFKPVGDNTGDVAAEGDMTLQGVIVAVDWILAYVTYMSKVTIARMITSPDFLKNESSYQSLVSVLTSYLPLFGENGSGRLKNIAITAPAFSELPPSDRKTIIIQNAWSATYVDHVRTVRISGALYIGA